MIKDTETSGTVKIVSGMVCINGTEYEWDAFTDTSNRKEDWSIIGDGYGSDYPNALDQAYIEDRIRRFLSGDM